MTIDEIFKILTVGILSGALFTVAPVMLGYAFTVFQRLFSKVN